MNAKRYADEYYITVRDVTAMTNILAAAEQTGKLNKEKNSMLAKLSNNFKSPLQSVIGFSQALIDGLGGDITDKQAKYVKIIHKNSKGLLHFLDKFLEFSHTESSLFKKDFRVFDLVNTIQNVIKEHESVLCEKNISLEFNSEELEKKTINSDENSIKIILNNILETSINLTDMGNITVIVKNPAAEDLVQRGLSNNTHDKNITKSFIQITVKDTGIGFSETEKSTIFDPYAAVETNNKKAILNAFILGTAYAVTNKLNGSLWINTEVNE